MLKSASSFNSNPQSKRRSSSMPKINIDEFSLNSHQLSLLMEELLTLKKEKEAIAEYNMQLQKSITESQLQSKELTTTQDKLHTETLSLQKSSKKLGSELIKNKKQIQELAEEVQRLDSEVENLQIKVEESEKKRKKESFNVNKLIDIALKMRNELNVQERERERFKSELICSQKQIKQLEEKVDGLRSTNLNFTKKIKVSINK